MAVTLDDARTASREAARWIVARLRDEGRALRDSHVASGLVARELDVVDRLAGILSMWWSRLDAALTREIADRAAADVPGGVE